MQKKSGCDILYKKMKSKNVSLAVEIYPREGTETFSVQIVGCNPPTLKFIPVRGRKRKIAKMRKTHLVEIYPREGTETRKGY